MTLLCITWQTFWQWLNNSQLVSTLILLVFGTLVYETWHKNKEVRRELIWWLMNHVAEYATIATTYWSEHPSQKTEHQILAARLKSEYSVLLTAIDDLSLNKTTQKQMREAVINLYEAATGGAFESHRKVSQETKIKALSLIATHSATLRRKLRACVA